MNVYGTVVDHENSRCLSRRHLPPPHLRTHSSPHSDRSVCRSRPARTRLRIRGRTLFFPFTLEVHVALRFLRRRETDNLFSESLERMSSSNRATECATVAGIHSTVTATADYHALPTAAPRESRTNPGADRGGARRGEAGVFHNLRADPARNFWQKFRDSFFNANP